MKIAFYISSLSGGGAEKVLCTLANRLSREKNEVYVVSLEKRPQFYSLDNDVEVRRISNLEKNKIVEMIYDYKFIRKTFNMIDADVSISFLSRCNILVLLANLFNKEKIIVCDRNNPIREHSLTVFRVSNLLYRRANKIVVQTKQIKDFYHNKLRKKIVIQENPIDSQALYTQLLEKDLTKDNTIISIGRLEPQKDFVTLIKAFALLKDDYKEWKLKIFGVGEMKEDIQKLIYSLGVADSVILCGHTKVPFYELNKSRVFVLSSNYEGFPNVLCEAMEAGLMCISSDCVSGPRELIHHGHNGWLFNTGDVDDLKRLLQNCLEAKTIPEIENNAKISVARLHLDNNIESWKKIIEC